ncbi:MAG TPA: iron-sulfur cluster repair di-iron protein [Chitinophagaceae bacterium]
MDQLISKTLSEIVNEQFQTASVFEKYNLDYCCNGKRSLRQACEDDNVPVDKIVEDIKNVYSQKSNALDFNSIKLYQLLEYIVYTHHSYIKKEMPQILSYLEKVSTKHGKRHNELYKIAEVFVDLCNELTHHMNSEEKILFPRIKQLEQNGFEPISFDINHYQYLELPIIDLEDDDEDADNIMAEIRRLTNNYTPPANACTSFKLLYSGLRAFEIDLHQYVHLENNILFPKALILEKEIQLRDRN